MAIGGENPVNITTSSGQETPAVATAPDGRYVVAWVSNNQDGDGRGVFVRRYDANGNPQSGEIQVNTTFANDQQEPAVAMDHNGNFVVVWHSKDQDLSGFGIYAQRFNAAGVAQGL